MTDNPVLPVAHFPDHWIDNLPTGKPLTFSISIVNDLQQKLRGWTCKVSITGYTPRSADLATQTFLHHWNKMFRNLEIPAATVLELGEITVPALPDGATAYHLVLQLFNLEDENQEAIINNYELKIAD